jgi:CspA family cold shock protein
MQQPFIAYTAVRVGNAGTAVRGWLAGQDGACSVGESLKAAYYNWRSSEVGNVLSFEGQNAVSESCSHSAIEAEGFRSLSEGDKVEFSIEQDPKGPYTVNVRRV